MRRTISGSLQAIGPDSQVHQSPSTAGTDAIPATIPRAAHAEPGAFTIAALGYKTLPPRPVLQTAPEVNIPPTFCSLQERNKFHDEV